MVTLQALFAMYQINAFFHLEPEFLECLQKVAGDPAKACVKSGVQKACVEMVEII